MDAKRKPAQELAAALGLHRAGKLGRAEAIYRRILKHDPAHADALHMLGLVAHQRAQYDEAVDLIRRAIACNPTVPFYYNHLGAALIAQGAHAEAIGACQTAVRLDPGCAEAYNNLGVALQAAGQGTEALASYRAAIRIKPGYLEARFGLGSALHELGDLEEAVACYRDAVRLRPDSAEAHNGLGAALRSQGRLEDALASFQRATRARPDFAEAQYNLGVALRDAGKVNEAMERFRAALHHRPDMAEAHYNLAEALQSEHLFDAAIAHYRSALDRKPGLANAWNNLGIIFRYQGEFDAAADCLRKAAALSATPATAVHDMAVSRTFTADDLQDVVALEQRLAQPDLPANEAIALHFALGKAYDDLGRYDEAFAQFTAGCRLRRGQYDYSVADEGKKISRLIAIFTGELLRRGAAGGSASKLPVFIVGMPRSGTTLVEQIVSSHPEVLGAGELLYLPQLETSLTQSQQSRTPFPECCAALAPDTAAALAKGYLDQLLALPGADGKTRIIDKLPGNFLMLGLIALLFPAARVIHCRRDPLDTCLSVFAQKFTGHHPYANDLSEIGNYYREYERLMAHWRSVLPIPMLEVDYEDVVADLPGSARQLVGFCGLAWDERCLAFHENQRPVRTASAWQVRQPLYRHAVGRWRHYEAHLAPLKKALGWH